MGIPSGVDVIKTGSYGSSMEPAGVVEITKEIERDANGRHAIVVGQGIDHAEKYRWPAPVHRLQ